MTKSQAEFILHCKVDRSLHLSFLSGLAVDIEDVGEKSSVEGQREEVYWESRCAHREKSNVPLPAAFCMVCCCVAA